MLCEHLAGGEAHDAAAHRGEHAELEAGERDGGRAETRRHEQRSGDRHLTRVLRTNIFTEVQIINQFL